MADRIRDKRLRNWSWFNNQVLDCYGPTIGADGIAVYMVLVRFADQAAQTSYPAVPTISAATGMSVRQVSRVLVALARHGLVRITPQYGPDGRQSSNLYTLLELPPAGGREDGARDILPPAGGRGDATGASTPPPASHRGDATQASPSLPPGHPPDATQASKQDSGNQTHPIQREGERPGPSPPAETFDAQTLRPWLAEQCAEAGLPASAVDFARELAAWQDQIASGRRHVVPTAKGQAADLRLWLRRAIAWAQSHPPEVKHGTAVPPAQRSAGPTAAAIAHSQAELAAGVAAILARKAAPGDGGPPDVPPL
ncbi:MAG TPA: helix-turn-helix domain-containing protein [Chloroflexia bacterium]|nr:helix-turn-helix domain-containing protein [Chloroflexia bacterium]